MTIFRCSVILPLILTMFDGDNVVSSGSVKLVGPKCGNLFDGDKADECGATLSVDTAFKTNLGSLCKNSDRLKLGVVRDDADIDGKDMIFRIIF